MESTAGILLFLYFITPYASGECISRVWNNDIKRISIILYTASVKFYEAWRHRTDKHHSVVVTSELKIPILLWVCVDEPVLCQLSLCQSGLAFDYMYMYVAFNHHQ